MKKIFVISMVLGVGFFLATGANADIAGSLHDFSTGNASATWTSSSDQICIACHTPHNARSGVADAPLWNRDITATNFTTLYSSPTFDGGPLGQPSGASKLCLSCHDGTVAMENFGAITGTAGTLMAAIGTGSAVIGGSGDLSGHHPVSFAYDAALIALDSELFNPATAPSGMAAGGTIQQDMLFADMLECSSCHDVHKVAGVGKFLVKANDGSDLCLTCHDK
jgi:predicted CXXCH cytochrome family protein